MKKTKGKFEKRIKCCYEKYKDKYPKDLYLYAEFESWIDEAKKEFPKDLTVHDNGSLSLFYPKYEIDKWFEKWFGLCL